ncbi:hypothetical protein F4808DRAFT_273938 [Astrocystis sublimbata]|nr:hypothetical protein F4808DRAFT_273938 [Astrocystis sublimbata]
MSQWPSKHPLFADLPGGRSERTPQTEEPESMAPPRQNICYRCTRSFYSSDPQSRRCPDCTKTQPIDGATLSELYSSRTTQQSNAPQIVPPAAQTFEAANIQYGQYGYSHLHQQALNSAYPGGTPAATAASNTQYQQGYGTTLDPTYSSGIAAGGYNPASQVGYQTGYDMPLAYNPPRSGASMSAIAGNDPYSHMSNSGYQMGEPSQPYGTAPELVSDLHNTVKAAKGPYRSIAPHPLSQVSDSSGSHSGYYPAESSRKHRSSKIYGKSKQSDSKSSKNTKK